MSVTLAAQCQCSKKAVKNLSSESLLAEADEDGIINVIGRNFFSECNLVRSLRRRCVLSSSPLKRSASEPNVHYSADYDDLCGPWPSPDHPTYEHYDDVALRPTLCTWTFITTRDAECMRQHMFDKEAIKFIIGTYDCILKVMNN